MEAYQKAENAKSFERAHARTHRNDMTRCAILPISSQNMLVSIVTKAQQKPTSDPPIGSRANLQFQLKYISEDLSSVSPEEW